VDAGTPLPLFGEAWAARWASEVAASEGYREAAQGWEGSLVLEATGERGQPLAAVWADLHHGECRETREATLGDLASAAYVLQAPVAVWEKLFAGTLEPMWALVSGKLKLARGALGGLVPYASAARELVAAARRVPTAFETTGPAGAVAPSATPRLPAPGSPAHSATHLPGGAAREGAGELRPYTGASSAATPELGEPSRRVFQTTSSAGLDRSSFPMRLWEKAKRRGVWNPSDLDLTADRADWLSLDDGQRDVLLRLASLFQAGEESVTRDLLPLVLTVAEEGRLEEEIYLTSFLFEEAKHVDFFRRFLDEVAEHRGDLSGYHSPSFRAIVYEALPQALGRLHDDSSPVAQAEASVTYNLIVEGVLAETGYHAFFTMLRERGLLPGVQQGIALLQSDEARHLAYGVWLLSRLVAEHGEPVWQAIERRMEALLPAALGVVEEAFAAYSTMPFALDRGAMLLYATRQFEARLRRIALARGGSLADLAAEPLEA
jgi:ribonucleoside-diphosphate reductase beta chain